MSLEMCKVQKLIFLNARTQSARQHHDILSMTSGASHNLTQFVMNQATC